MNTDPHLLVSFVLAEEMTLNTCEMNRRNIPISVRPDRTPAMLAKMISQSEPFKDGPLFGFRITGSNRAGGYQLVDQHNCTAAVILANGVFKVEWVPGYLDKLQLYGKVVKAGDIPAWCNISEHWIAERVADLRDKLERDAVRRMFLKWIRDIGFQDTGIPSLYWAPLFLRNELETIIDALPEAEWTVWEAREV